MARVVVVPIAVPTEVLAVVVVPPENRVVLGLVYRIFGCKLAELLLVF